MFDKWILIQVWKINLVYAEQWACSEICVTPVAKPWLPWAMRGSVAQQPSLPTWGDKIVWVTSVNSQHVSTKLIWKRRCHIHKKEDSLKLWPCSSCFIPIISRKWGIWATILLLPPRKLGLSLLFLGFSLWAWFGVFSVWFVGLVLCFVFKE